MKVAQQSGSEIEISTRGSIVCAYEASHRADERKRSPDLF